MSSNTSKQTFFEIAVVQTLFEILFFSVLINLSATTDFSSFYVEYISMLFTFKKSLKELLQNSLP